MDLKDIILGLEKKLQQPEIRKSAAQLDDLISNDLIEFGSSGAVYGKSDVLKNLPDSPEFIFLMTDFAIRILSDDIVQSTFKTEKTNILTGKVSKSLRSSIWKNESGKWRMLFHQGTPYAN